jgi:3',5'-cyclic-AMP phosphodiesterase
MSTHDRVLLAQISDPHIRVGPGDRDPAAALSAAVAGVAAFAPDAVVITGDLTEDGRDAEYARVLELLAPLRQPVHVLPGNHDGRDALRAAMKPPADPDCPAPFVQYTAAFGRLRLVVCDTIVAGSDGGRMCDERLAWLEARLADDRETPTVVAMHHPPLVTGVPAMDAIGLAGETRTALAAMLREAPNVRRVVAGHVHRTAFATLGGRAVFACPSTDAELGLDLGGAADLRLGDTTPAFALHLDTGDAMTTHVQTVAGARPR